MILSEARESDLGGVAGAFDEGRASRNEGVAIRAARGVERRREREFSRSSSEAAAATCTSGQK
jgi:hypothetical protein